MLDPAFRVVDSQPWSAHENGHRHDTGAARGRINLNLWGERGEAGGED